MEKPGPSTKEAASRSTQPTPKLTDFDFLGVNSGENRSKANALPKMLTEQMLETISKYLRKLKVSGKSGELQKSWKVTLLNTLNKNSRHHAEDEEIRKRDLDFWLKHESLVKLVQDLEVSEKDENEPGPSTALFSAPTSTCAVGQNQSISAESSALVPRTTWSVWSNHTAVDGTLMSDSALPDIKVDGKEKEIPSTSLMVGDGKEKAGCADGKVETVSKTCRTKKRIIFEKMEMEGYKKPEVAAKKSVVASKKSEVASKKSEVASKKSEVASKKSVVASKKSEVASKKSEVTSKKPKVASKKSEDASKKSEVASKKSVVASKKSEVASKKSVVASKKSVVASNKSVVASKKSEVASKKSEVASKKSEVASKKSEVASKKSEVASKKSEVASKKSEIEIASKKSEIEIASKKSEVASKKSEVASKKSGAASKKPVITSKKSEVAFKKSKVASKNPREASKQKNSVSEKKEKIKWMVSFLSKPKKVATKKAKRTSKKAPTSRTGTQTMTKTHSKIIGNYLSEALARLMGTQRPLRSVWKQHLLQKVNGRRIKHLIDEQTLTNWINTDTNFSQLLKKLERHQHMLETNTLEAAKLEFALNQVSAPALAQGSEDAVTAKRLDKSIEVVRRFFMEQAAANPEPGIANEDLEPMETEECSAVPVMATGTANQSMELVLWSAGNRPSPLSDLPSLPAVQGNDGKSLGLREPQKASHDAGLEPGQAAAVSSGSTSTSSLEDGISSEEDSGIKSQPNSRSSPEEDRKEEFQKADFLAVQLETNDDLYQGFQYHLRELRKNHEKISARQGFQSDDLVVIHNLIGKLESYGATFNAGSRGNQ